MCTLKSPPYSLLIIILFFFLTKPTKAQVPKSGPAALLELVFLIDATSVNQPYIDKTTETVEELISTLYEKKAVGVRIGVTCYRDYVSKSNQSKMGQVTEVITPLTTDWRTIIPSLKKIREAPKIKNDNFPSAGFDGLYAAVTETKWNQTKSSLRCIIWIGAASAHPAGDDKNPLNYSLEQIKKTCSKSRVRILGLKIGSLREKDNKIHRNQMQLITTGLHPADRGYFAETNNLFDYQNILYENIKKEYELLEVLAKSSSGFNTKRSDYWKKPGKKEIYMLKDELDLCITYMSILTVITENTNEKQIINTARQVLETQTGNNIEPYQTLKNHYETSLKIPVFSSLLNLSFEDIENMNAEELKKVYKQAQSKLTLLQSHKNEAGNWIGISDTFLRYTFVPNKILP